MAQFKKIKIGGGGGGGGGGGDESSIRWLISYSDFMMQLVCLFILLYSVSSIDVFKAAEAAAAYRASIGIGEPPLIRPPAPRTKLPAIGETSLIGGELGQAHAPPGVRFEVKDAPEGLLVDFPAPIFDRGSAELSKDAEAALGEIAGVLRAYVGTVAVSGFVDSDPTDASGGDGLWLSQLRAEAVAKFVTRRGLDPRSVMAAGRGVGAPEQARRVEILLRLK